LHELLCESIRCRMRNLELRHWPPGDFGLKTGVSTDIGTRKRTSILGKERHPGCRTAAQNNYCKFAVPAYGIAVAVMSPGALQS